MRRTPFGPGVRIRQFPPRRRGFAGPSPFVLLVAEGVGRTMGALTAWAVVGATAYVAWRLLCR